MNENTIATIAVLVVLYLMVLTAITVEGGGRIWSSGRPIRLYHVCFAIFWPIMVPLKGIKYFIRWPSAFWAENQRRIRDNNWKRILGRK